MNNCMKNIYQKWRKKISQNLVNIPGWRTDRKLIVIESDDWGSIRMPSKEAHNKLLKEGIRVDRSIYDSYDILEQRKDLEDLFELILSFKNKKSNHPIFTFNTVMCNPAFQQIKECEFESYHNEEFSISYSRYNGENIIDLWYDAIDQKLIQPQFHAREHLNVSLWMKALKNKHKATRKAFDHHFFGLKTQTPSAHQKNYLAAYWAESVDDYKQKLEILRNGLEMFEEVFGFKSESFVACNFIFPEAMEQPLSKFGIKYIQNQRGHISPDIYTGRKKIKRHFTGQSNRYNQFYLVRNCTFEPTLDENSVEKCLNEIKTAFKWNKPAVISSHRINYVGGIETKNKQAGLRKLKELLNKILEKWPEVEFLSSDQLGKIIEE